MYAKGRKKGTVQFVVKAADGAAQVYLAGAFRNWEPLPMRRQQDGRFALELKLPPGTHEYKFVIDGQWMTDPDHGQCEPNPYGSFNSVVRVE